MDLSTVRAYPPKIVELIRGLRARSLILWIGYPSFFFFCFLFFAYQTFPYDRVREKLVQIVSDQGYQVEIIDLAPSWGTGISMEGVRVILPSQTEGSPPLDVVIDELTLRLGLISYLFKTTDVTFDAELAGGHAEGNVVIGKETLHIEAEFESVALDRIAALRRYTKLPIAGSVTAELELDLPAKPDEATGSAKATIEGLSIGDDKAQIDIPGWGGFTVDRANLGTLELDALVDKGQMKIERLQAHGKDINLDANGSLRLDRPLTRSSLNVLARIEILDAYKQRSARIASVLDLAKDRPEFKAASTANGALQYKLSGSLGGRINPTPMGREKFTQRSAGRKDKGTQ